MRRWLVGLGWIVFVVALSAATGRTATNAPILEQHVRLHWLGSDAAFTVPLHDGRILWLFNDTVVATTPSHVRDGAAFVRNTLAIERGTSRVGEPCAVAHAACEATPRARELLRRRGGNLVDGYAVSLAIRGQGFTGYLIRWRVGDLTAGRLEKAEWWADQRGWVPISGYRGTPTLIIAKAGPECSLTFDPKLGRWVLVRSEGFGATTIVVSFARKIEGPWSTPRFVYRPPESDAPDPNVYAAKGHPELTGADLVVTYATKTYPRFVRLTFSRK